MGSVKQLAGQTIWYGLSSIVARFLNYLMTPYLTGVFTLALYGEISNLYSLMPLLNVLFTYGMETAYFRFHNSPDKKRVFNTICMTLISTTVLFTVCLFFFRHILATILNIEQHADYIVLVSFIVAFDTLSAIPFAKLRQEGKPRKYATIKFLNILVNISCSYFFISVCHKWVNVHSTGFTSTWYNPNWSVGYLFLSNLIASLCTLIALSKEFSAIEWEFDKVLWKKIILYALPMLLVGFGGMINETFDRFMLGKLANFPTSDLRNEQIGIYSACYKLSMLITFSVQAFRMASEPFFFQNADKGDAKRNFARVMKFFVITVSIMFLVVALFIDIWKHFISNHRMWEGLAVVPILLLANMFLGIYYNLSIWYKLGNKTYAGAIITIIGAFITIIVNLIFIPYFSYMASAWATLLCYGSMMVISFIWGQKEYYIPYAWKKLIAFIVIVLLLYWFHNLIDFVLHNQIINLITGAGLLSLYCYFIYKIEYKEFVKLKI